MSKLAEREGFEPSIRFKTYTPLAGERLQPLGHLSVTPCLFSTQALGPHALCWLTLVHPTLIRCAKLARPEGFEPPTAWFVARYSIQLSYGRGVLQPANYGRKVVIGQAQTLLSLSKIILMLLNSRTVPVLFV